jgi:hypothetical protein
LDVVKTRIQNRNFENPESGMNIIKDLLRKEGVTGFFKGLTPKILVVRRIFFARVVEREKWGWRRFKTQKKYIPIINAKSSLHFDFFLPAGRP